jgi:hypothetical protein
MAHLIFVCSWTTRLIFVSSIIEGQMSFVIIIVVCCRNNLTSVSSFACCNCLLPQTCLASAYTHYRLVFIGMLFLCCFAFELVRIFVTINRAANGSLHCCLLLEKSVSMSSSSIEGQVSFIIVVCHWKKVPVLSFARWNHFPLPQTCLACVYVHCRLVYITVVT